MNYVGSYIFKPVADQLGIEIYYVSYLNNLKIFLTISKFLPIKFNFLVAEFAAILLGLVFRSVLPALEKNILKRHLFNITAGIVLSYFCFGYEIVHIFLQTVVGYLGLKFLPRQYSHMYFFH